MLELAPDICARRRHQVLYSNFWMNDRVSAWILIRRKMRTEPRCHLPLKEEALLIELFSTSWWFLLSTDRYCSPICSDMI